MKHVITEEAVHVYAYDHKITSPHGQNVYWKDASHSAGKGPSLRE